MVVQGKGFEPSRFIQAHAPQTCVSTCSTTPASYLIFFSDIYYKLNSIYYQLFLAVNPWVYTIFQYFCINHKKLDLYHPLFCYL